jgi:hypothetical protein
MKRTLGLGIALMLLGSSTAFAQRGAGGASGSTSGPTNLGVQGTSGADIHGTTGRASKSGSMSGPASGADQSMGAGASGDYKNNGAANSPSSTGASPSSTKTR